MDSEKKYEYECDEGHTEIDCDEGYTEIDCEELVDELLPARLPDDKYLEKLKYYSTVLNLMKSYTLENGLNLADNLTVKDLERIN